MCGTALADQIVSKTRKPHRCFGCDRMIPQGTRAEKWTSVDSGDISSSYFCLDCAEYSHTPAGRDNADDDGCIGPGTYAEAEYARFPILIPREVLACA